MVLPLALNDSATGLSTILWPEIASARTAAAAASLRGVTCGVSLRSISPDVSSPHTLRLWFSGSSGLSMPSGIPEALFGRVEQPPSMR